MISEKELSERITDNDIRLLGQVHISENEYHELLDYSRMFIRNASPSLGIRVDLRLAITLVQVAIREYKEGRYWTYFCDAIDDQVSSSKLNYCGKVFAATVKKLGLIYIDRSDSSNQMYVENIKVHAIVTNYYMTGFWDFLSSYYEKNLFRQITDELDEDVELLSLFMKNTLEDNSDSFVGEESKGKASKSYKLLKATRNLIAYSDVESNRRVLLPNLTLIDNYYYDSELPSDDDRFSRYFCQWCRDKELAEDKPEQRKRNRLLSSRRPYIHVDFEKMSYLCIPSQKFREGECEGEASVLVTINGYDKNFDLEIYKSFGIYISEPIRIPIPSIFDEISICIESGVVKKYKILSSNYRILNKNHDVSQKLSLGDNLLLTEKGTSVSYEGQTTCVDSTNEYSQYDFYSISISDDSIIHVGKRTISLAGEYSEIPFFEEEVTDFSVEDSDGRDIIVSRTHPVVSFIVNEQKVSGTVLVVNGIKCPIDQINKKNVCSAITPNDKAITIDLEKFLPPLEGVFEVLVDIPDERNKVVPKYVRLSKIDISFNRSLYTSTDEILVWVRNGDDKVWPEREDVELVAIQVNADEYHVPIVKEEDEIRFHLELNDDLIIKAPLCLLKTGFSTDSLSFVRPDYIWYSDLKETLYCSAPDVNEIRVYLNHDKNQYMKGFPVGNGTFRVDISDIKQKIVDNAQDGWAYINALCIGERRRSFLLYSVLRQMWVDPYFDFTMVDGQLCFDLTVNGDAQLEIDIEDEYTKEKLVQGKRIHTGITRFPELKPNGAYNLFPKMIEGDEFGLSTTVVAMRPIYNQSYIGLDDITDCRLVIGDLLYLDEKRSLSYDYFVDIREKKDNETYEGYMFGLKKAPRHKGEYKGKYEIGNDGKPVKKKFGRVLIKLLEQDEKAVFIQIYTNTYEESNSEWIELYYDNYLKTLLHCNDHVLSQNNSYDRFEFLDAEDTRFKVMKKKIGRLKKDAI